MLRCLSGSSAAHAEPPEKRRRLSSISSTSAATSPGVSSRHSNSASEAGPTGACRTSNCGHISCATQPACDQEDGPCPTEVASLDDLSSASHTSDEQSAVEALASLCQSCPRRRSHKRVLHHLEEAKMLIEKHQLEQRRRCTTAQGDPSGSEGTCSSPPLVQQRRHGSEPRDERPSGGCGSSGSRGCGSDGRSGSGSGSGGSSSSYSNNSTSSIFSVTAPSGLILKPLTPRREQPPPTSVDFYGSGVRLPSARSVGRTVPLGTCSAAAAGAGAGAGAGALGPRHCDAAANVAPAEMPGCDTLPGMSGRRSGQTQPTRLQDDPINGPGACADSEAMALDDSKVMHIEVDANSPSTQTDASSDSTAGASQGPAAARCRGQRRLGDLSSASSVPALAPTPAPSEVSSSSSTCAGTGTRPRGSEGAKQDQSGTAAIVPMGPPPPRPPRLEAPALLHSRPTRGSVMVRALPGSLQAAAADDVNGLAPSTPPCGELALVQPDTRQAGPGQGSGQGQRRSRDTPRSLSPLGSSSRTSVSMSQPTSQSKSRLDGQLALLVAEEHSPAGGGGGGSGSGGGSGTASPVRLCGYRPVAAELTAGPDVFVPVASVTGIEGQTLHMKLRLSPLVHGRRGRATAASLELATRSLEAVAVQAPEAAGNKAGVAAAVAPPLNLGYRDAYHGRAPSPPARPGTPPLEGPQLMLPGTQPREAKAGAMLPLESSDLRRLAWLSLEREKLVSVRTTAAKRCLPPEVVTADMSLTRLDQLVSTSAAAYGAAARTLRWLQPSMTHVSEDMQLLPWSLKSFYDPDGSLLQGVVLKAACTVAKLHKMLSTNINISLPWSEAALQAHGDALSGGTSSSSAAAASAGHQGLGRRYESRSSGAGSGASASSSAAGMPRCGTVRTARRSEPLSVQLCSLSAAAAASCRPGRMPLELVLNVLLEFAGAAAALRQAESRDSDGNDDDAATETAVETTGAPASASASLPPAAEPAAALASVSATGAPLAAGPAKPGGRYATMRPLMRTGQECFEAVLALLERLLEREHARSSPVVVVPLSLEPRDGLQGSPSPQGPSA